MMDAEISFAETPNSNAFAAQARALAHTPTLAEWLKYWNDTDTGFGNLSNLQHWLQQAQRTNASKPMPSMNANHSLVPIPCSRFPPTIPLLTYPLPLHGQGG
jgi:hypothetical protein